MFNWFLLSFLPQFVSKIWGEGEGGEGTSLQNCTRQMTYLSPNLQLQNYESNSKHKPQPATQNITTTNENHPIATSVLHPPPDLWGMRHCSLDTDSLTTVPQVYDISRGKNYPQNEPNTSEVYLVMSHLHCLCHLFCRCHDILWLQLTFHWRD